MRHVLLEDDVEGFLAVEDFLKIDNVGVMNLSHDGELLNHVGDLHSVLVGHFYSVELSIILVSGGMDDRECTTV